ncbi:hypothetical protein J2857_005256 [Neorhizobium galegae]|uniref:CBS domain-containing protein n=1 Tax=Neorhizobium galegae TaxID=399 RepID=UPI001AE5FC84|nr:CBS domain-containing protein [Neorhizobium galegae]MBP2562465.1 hypothetical protein [Neorhizobium galegae]
MLSVRSIMTPNPTTIGPEAKIWEAATTMLDRRVNGLPVVGDVLRRGEFHTGAHHGLRRTLFPSRGTLAEDYAKSFGKDVGEVMSSPAVSVEPETTVEVAAEIMGALIRELAGYSATKADADIRNALETELAKHRWGDAIAIRVAEGVVALEGREKTALRVAAENTTGVKRVDDSIEVVQPLDMPVPPPGFYL